MEFFLFILVNAAMFIRPAEIAQELSSVPIYLILIVACLAVSFPKLLTKWSSQPLAERPLSACVLGLLAAVILSHVSHFEIGLARWWGLDFAKVVLYYLLLVAIVDSPARLRRFLLCLVILITAMTTLAVLQYHGAIHIAALEVLERSETDPATGEIVTVYQLVGTGIFNDPNDLCVMLATGIITALYIVNDKKYGMYRWFAVVPIALLSYAVKLTQSRGGLLALLAGLFAYFVTRFGGRKAVIMAAVCVPALIAVMGGRMARLSAGEDTAQQRIELWRDAMVLFRGAPVFGIGANTLDGEIGLVAHNSYVHSFAEMGFFGGSLFVGMFYLALRMLLRLGGRGVVLANPELRRLRPYLIATVASTAVGLYSISATTSRQLIS